MVKYLTLLFIFFSTQINADSNYNQQISEFTHGAVKGLLAWAGTASYVSDVISKNQVNISVSRALGFFIAKYSFYKFLMSNFMHHKDLVTFLFVLDATIGCLAGFFLSYSDKKLPLYYFQ